MNKSVLIAVASVISLPLSSFAGHAIVDKNPKNPVPPPSCFADQELQLDVYAAYVDSESDSSHGDGWGGGLGLNYYFQRNVGVGLDATITTGSPSELWQFSAFLLLRYPIEGSFCWAPYMKLGGGWEFNGDNEGFLLGGGGVEFRFNPKWGFFTEATFNWADNDSSSLQARAGFRFVF
jgi:hypothetical protein